MKIKFLLFCFFLSAYGLKSQVKTAFTFVHDTMSVPEKNKVLEGEYLETALKNLSVIRMFKSNEDHYFLRMIVTQNFYFDKVAMLEIRSGTKSYYAKDTKQHKVTKTQGLFLIEIHKNYIATLKEEGITSIVFGEAETDFTKQDASQIKKMAATFYESIASAKK